MADIQAYLDAIENAIYGEDVRGSIHDAIEIINEVGEVVITAGTAVTSASSSTEGFFENSLYFNTNTNDLWQCNGSGWTLLGNLKGDQGDQGNPGQAATIAVGTVTKGENASVVNSGTSSAAVFDFVLPKGDPGPAGANSWGDIDGDINDQTDLKNALEDVYAQSEELVDRTVGWVCNNLFDIEAVEMGKDIYGEAAANSALFTLNCKPSTRYYLSVHGTNNLQVSYNTTALGPTEVLIASFPYDFLTTQYDTYIKICFTKSGLTKSDIEALQFMLSEVANAPYSEHHPTVEEELADKAPISLLKDTVGWVGKNLVPIPSSVVTTTDRGITFTIYRDDAGQVIRINVDGTNTAGQDIWFFLNSKINSYLENGKEYILSGCPSGGSDTTYRIGIRDVGYEYGSGKKFTFASQSYDIWYAINIPTASQVNNKDFYPMLRDASITDSTFEPYHKSVEDTISDVYGVMGENGAKNIGVNNATTQTIDGVIFTVNSDKSITITGKNTGASYITYDIARPITIPKGHYKMRGSSDFNNNFYLQLRKSDGNISYFDTGSGAEFTLDQDMTFNYWAIIVPQGDTQYNVVVEPMIWLASDTDDTYAPYAMTNRELTQEVTPIEGTITSDFTINSSTSLKKVGKVVIASIMLEGVTKDAFTNALFTVPAGFRPIATFTPALMVIGNNGVGRCTVIGSSGQAQSSVGLSNQNIFINATWITD